MASKGRHLQQLVFFTLDSETDISGSPLAQNSGNVAPVLKWFYPPAFPTPSPTRTKPLEVDCRLKVDLEHGTSGAANGFRFLVISRKRSSSESKRG